MESGGKAVTLTPAFSAGVTSYTIPAGTTAATVEAIAENTSLTVVVSCNGESYVVNAATNNRTNQFSNLKSGDYITVTVTNGASSGMTNTYKIKVS